MVDSTKTAMSVLSLIMLPQLLIRGFMKPSDAQRAILLGCVRRSMSLLDHPRCEPVRSLRYFASLVEEVRTESFLDSCWPHPQFSLRRCERVRQDRRAK